jgi:hypothetical protein
MTTPAKWDDGLADAWACVQAVRQDDTEGLAVVLRHGNPVELSVTLAKLVAEVLDEQQVTPEWFREWAESAVNRS